MMQIASLDQKALDMIKATENQLSSTTGKQIVLLAYTDG